MLSLIFGALVCMYTLGRKKKSEEKKKGQVSEDKPSFSISRRSKWSVKDKTDIYPMACILLNNKRTN